MKCEFVLDEGPRALLAQLAKSRGNNRSFVVREALRVYAAVEEMLDDLEQTPRFRRMMASAAADVRTARLHSHAEAERIVRARKR